MQAMRWYLDELGDGSPEECGQGGGIGNAGVGADRLLQLRPLLGGRCQEGIEEQGHPILGQGAQRTQVAAGGNAGT